MKKITITDVMRDLGKLGRAKNTEAQATASRQNGAKGGRPIGSKDKVKRVRRPRIAGMSLIELCCVVTVLSMLIIGIMLATQAIVVQSQEVVAAADQHTGQVDDAFETLHKSGAHIGSVPQPQTNNPEIAQ